VAVSYALLTLGWHYPSDVLGGYLVSALWMTGAVAALRAAGERWPARSGREAAVRWGTALAPAGIGALVPLVGLAAVALTRPDGAVRYAAAHTAFVFVAAALAAAAAATAGAFAAALRR
jgi:hypothetical protein